MHRNKAHKIGPSFCSGGVVDDYKYERNITISGVVKSEYVNLRLM